MNGITVEWYRSSCGTDLDNAETASPELWATFGYDGLSFGVHLAFQDIRTTAGGPEFVELPLPNSGPLPILVCPGNYIVSRPIMGDFAA